MTTAFQIPGLYPLVCSYYISGRKFGIVLYASDPAQVLRDWSWSLPGLEVEGVLIGTERG